MTEILHTIQRAPVDGSFFGLSGMSEENLLRQLEAAELKIIALREELGTRQSKSSPVSSSAD